MGKYIKIAPADGLPITPGHQHDTPFSKIQTIGTIWKCGKCGKKLIINKSRDWEYLPSRRRLLRKVNKYNASS